jgi:predicted acylesterase/phospholipase RssA
MRIPYVPPKRLILSGGGLRVVSYLGVLQVLEERKLLSSIREFCGVSAGALMATMLALGYSLAKLERFFLEYNFGEIRTLEPENIFLLFEQFGMDTGEKLMTLIHKFFYHKGFHPDVTFKELQDSGKCKGLRIWAADIQMARPIEFSASLTPNISVSFALRASTAIPGYFTPVKHPETGLILGDGGVFDNYPISYLNQEEAKESLGIAFVYKSFPQPCPDFGKYLGLVITGYYIPSYQKLLEQHKCRTIELPCYEFSSLNFEAGLDEKKRLITIGREASEAFFNRKTYGRRNSV